MNGILLLNADYRPISIIPLDKLVSLLSKENKIEIVETVPGKLLRSTFDAQPFPSVVRLRHYVNVPQRHVMWSRKAVFTRDGYTCVFCNKKLTRENATIDHLIPQVECRKRGIHASTWGNTVTACEDCNRRKADKTMRDAGMKFFDPNYEPKTPRVSYLVVSGEIPEQWKMYVKV